MVRKRKSFDAQTCKTAIGKCTVVVLSFLSLSAVIGRERPSLAEFTGPALGGDQPPRLFVFICSDDSLGRVSHL
jgi:hypothetical protein